jgi:tetratricopeptide (TPR) repeat protein
VRPRSAVEGLHHHREARLDRASALYLEALAIRPDDADTLHLLGFLRHQQGRSLEAVELVARAIAINPNIADWHNNLGIVLTALGRLDEAVAAFRHAIAMRPAYPEAHNNLGNVLRSLGRPAEAAASYREAVRLRPDDADAHCNLATALLDLGQPAEAEANYREALRLRPGFPEAHRNLGTALYGLGRLVEAEASYREALRLRPDYAEAHANLGTVLYVFGRLVEAEASYREALRLRPDYPDAHNNLGATLRDLGRPAEAEACYRAALRLRPDYADAHSSLGTALYDLGRRAEAEASCREALRLLPGLAEAHYSLGLPLLLAGRFEEGWKEYEWRWKTRHMAGSTRSLPAPQWNGEPIGDRVILLHAEQGLGDTLQFCRYVPLIACGARTVLEVQAPLVRLLCRLPGITQIVAQGERLPSFDLHCPLMSLPRAVGTTLDSIPAVTPYLAADRALAAAWRERLAGLDGLRVGLVWAGGPRLEWPGLAAVDRRRSIALDTMAPFAQVGGVSFVSLQKGAPAVQAVNPPRGMALHDFAADLHDFADTGALIDGLDLVISVDTAVAHLAGALGKPVWLLNRFDTCWRWLLNRDDSPWYPTLRQFRQRAIGDWDGVIYAVRDALRCLAAGDRDQLRPRQTIASTAGAGRG